MVSRGNGRAGARAGGQLPTPAVHPRFPALTVRTDSEARRLVAEGLAAILSKHRGREAYVKTCEVVRAVYALLGYNGGRRPVYPVDLSIAADLLRRIPLVQANGASWVLVGEEVRSYFHYFRYRRVGG